MFAAALPCLIGVWALSGFDLSLGPSLAAQLLRSQNLLWGGFVIALLFGVGVPVTSWVPQLHPVQSHARRVPRVVRRRPDHIRRDRDEDTSTVGRRLRRGRPGVGTSLHACLRHDRRADAARRPCRTHRRDLHRWLSRVQRSRRDRRGRGLAIRPAQDRACLLPRRRRASGHRRRQLHGSSRTPPTRCAARPRRIQTRRPGPPTIRRTPAARREPSEATATTCLGNQPLTRPGSQSRCKREAVRDISDRHVGVRRIARCSRSWYSLLGVTTGSVWLVVPCGGALVPDTHCAHCRDCSGWPGEQPATSERVLAGCIPQRPRCLGTSGRALPRAVQADRHGQITFALRWKLPPSRILSTRQSKKTTG